MGNNLPEPSGGTQHHSTVILASAGQDFGQALGGTQFISALSGLGSNGTIGRSDYRWLLCAAWPSSQPGDWVWRAGHGTGQRL